MNEKNPLSNTDQMDQNEKNVSTDNGIEWDQRWPGLAKYQHQQ